MKQMGPMTAVIAASTFACAALLSFSWSERGGVSLSVENAQARVGRPLTPVSVAGVARRQNRRAAYGYGAVGAGLAGGAIGAAAIAAASPYGYYGGGPYVGTGWGDYDGYGTGGYYGGGYANRSYVTGRPTLFPRYYGGYGTGGYDGSYAAAGYPGYYGGYANRSYVTGRPTLFPRYYGGDLGSWW
jgi:hypothetical protein